MKDLIELLNSMSIGRIVLYSVIFVVGLSVILGNYILVYTKEKMKI